MHALGIDLGGTHIKIALVDAEGNLSYDSTIETPVKLGPSGVINEIKKAGKILIKKTRKSRVAGIGVGVAGDVDQYAGKIRFSPNLNWKNVFLGKELKRYFKLPVIVDNDANAAAWGAYMLEARENIKHLITVTLGTGVGGGIIIDGKLYRGASGSAGEIGHMTIYPEGLKCSCGSRGCLECYVGAPHLVRQANAAVRKGRKTIISSMVHGRLEAVTPIIIEMAAKRGDALAKEIWTNAGKNLGIAMGSLINIFNPEMIVLAGGTSRAGRLLTEPMWRSLKRNSFINPRKHLSIILSQRDKDLGVAGAGLLVWGAREKKIT
ncbi:MAG: ROK family protein [Elusimicrobia bacterium]|nr:ROK family protein [Elusimicrobiota bacterium]MBD3412688.1 ROK family protein [Elusimicrobiota bacterium]